MKFTDADRLDLLQKFPDIVFPSCGLWWQNFPPGKSFTILREALDTALDYFAENPDVAKRLEAKQHE